VNSHLAKGGRPKNGGGGEQGSFTHQRGKGTTIKNKGESPGLGSYEKKKTKGCTKKKCRGQILGQKGSSNGDGRWGHGPRPSEVNQRGIDYPEESSRKRGGLNRDEEMGGKLEKRKVGGKRGWEKFSIVGRKSKKK